MGRRESVLESWAVKQARVRGIVVAKLTEVDGIPDRIFFMPGGKPLIVEFKKKGQTGRGLQEITQPWYLNKLTEDGYAAIYCDTKEAFIELMERTWQRRKKKSKI